MKKLFFILPVAAMLFAACDKIDINEDGVYGTLAGASGEWMDGNGVSDKTQRAFVEKYTGARCVNCPTADEVVNAALTSNGDKMIAVAIDSPGSLGNPYSNNPDLRTEDGNTWCNYFGAVEQLPAYMVNRNPATPSTAYTEIPNDVTSAIAGSTKVAVAVENSQSGDNASIKVDLEFVETVSDPLTLTLFIMEDSIVAKQLMPTGTANADYVHNHVMRDVITDVWGADIDATGAAGEKRTATFRYTVNSSWVKEHCHIVAFVSDKSSKAILNAAECELVK